MEFLSTQEHLRGNHSKYVDVSVDVKLEHTCISGSCGEIDLVLRHHYEYQGVSALKEHGINKTVPSK